MKKLVIGFLLLLAASVSATQDTMRVSVLYLHRSVGLSVVQNCTDPYHGGPHNIRETLAVQASLPKQEYQYKTFGDTLNVRYVFRQADLNGTPAARLSDTTFTGTCGEYNLGADFYGQTPAGATSAGSFKLYYNGGSPLKALFDDNQRTITASNGKYPWEVFMRHRVPTATAGDSVYEKYTIVIAKQPYAIWMHDTYDPYTGFEASRRDQYKTWLRAIRDTVYNHPEIPAFVFDVGSPLARLHTNSRTVYEYPNATDSVYMKRVYEFAKWCSDTLVQEVQATPIRRNFFVMEYLTELVDTTTGSVDRWFLDPDNWAADGASHLSALGQAIAQREMTRELHRITGELLEQREWRLDNASLYGGGTAAERAHACSLIALRAWIGASGDYNDYNIIKAINPDFKWLLYISSSDGYISGAAADVQEKNWMDAALTGAGYNPELQWLHYRDATTITGTAEGTFTCPGVLNATTLADTIASRVRFYAGTYTNRIAKNHASPIARLYHKRYTVDRLKTLPPNSQVGYYDGVAWDNTGYRIYSTFTGPTGAIISGGHIDEAPIGGGLYYRVDSISPIGNQNGWYWTQLRQFLQEIRDTFDLGDQWMPNGKDVHSAINYATDWVPNNNLLNLPKVAHSVSTEFNYNPVGDYGLTFIDTLFYRDSVLYRRGIFSKSNPEPKYDFGTDGAFARRQLWVSALAMFMTYASPMSSIGMMRYQDPVPTNGLNAGWDTMTWAPIFNKQFGPYHTTRPSVYLSGVNDGKGQAVKIYRRDYEYATVFFRARGGTDSNGDDVDTLAAYSFALPSALREALFDGTASSPVSTTSLRPGEGRIFWNTNAVVYSPAVNISGVTLSATCNDCNNATELDNFVAAVSTGTEVNAGATIQVIYSTTAQPTNWASPITAAYAVSSTINIPITGVNGTEDYTLYVAVRLLKADASTTTPIYATLFNNNITPSLTALSVVNTASNPAGTLDQFTVTYQTPNNGTIDNVAFGYSTTSFAAITTPSQTIGFTPNFTGTVSHSGDYAEPYTLYVKGWLLENGEYTPTPLQASVDVGGTPPVTTTVHKTTIKGAVRIKGNVRIK